MCCKILLLINQTNSWTPGIPITLLDQNNTLQWRWHWRNATVPRQQDSIFCPANTACPIMNVTARSDSILTREFKKIRYRYVLFGTSSINISITSLVNFTCCSVNASFPANYKVDLLDAMFRCNETGWNNSGFLQIHNSQFVWCKNSTIIVNRTMWNDLIWIIIRAPNITKNTSSQIVRLPRTCTNVSVLAPKNLLHFNLTFPSIPSCARKRRAWYDTFLGSVGSGFGIANSIDLEVLAHRLKNTGKDVREAITVNAQWLPTTILPHAHTLNYQKQVLRIFNSTILKQYRFDTNVSALFKWTECSLQNLYTLLQKETAQRILMQGNPQMWRSLFSLPNQVWVSLDGSNVNCTGLWCVGTIVYYTPLQTKMLCAFHVLPILVEDHFLHPQIEGTHIDNDNVTYKLEDCISTDKGPMCNGLTRIIEPCLLSHSVNVCLLTVYPVMNFSVIYEVEPQHVCLVSANATDLLRMGLPVPFSGCVQKLDLLYWFGSLYCLLPELNNDVFVQWVPQYLRPPNLYLELSLAEILRNSEELQKHLHKNEKALEEYRIATTIVKNKLLNLHNAVIQDSNHRWWDFLFQSSSNLQMIVYKFIILFIILFSLLGIICGCQCWMARRRRQQQLHLLQQAFLAVDLGISPHAWLAQME